jgi:hypothetical protein
MAAVSAWICLCQCSSGQDLNVSFTAFCNFFQFVQTASLLFNMLPSTPLNSDIKFLNLEYLPQSAFPDSFPYLCNY